jgi:putative ATPase
MKPEQPLAERVRPQSLKDFIGQPRLVGKGKPIQNLIESGRLFSLIFWGPPGSGKTTLARVIANETDADFFDLSAVAAGKKDVLKVLEKAQESQTLFKRQTVLFLDEIHRFNKAQQDTLLPYVEDGTIILIGATTENPSFEVIGPLLSRCRVYTLERLAEAELKKIVRRALKEVGVRIEPVALDFLVQAANGDARVALNTLELAASQERASELKVTAIKNVLQSRLLYDKKGDYHYNTVSAFIKSLRGSDPDAALYYLARMVEAGEDPLFIARRMVIFASEDVGNADPQALLLAVSVFEACERIGRPECQINLAQGATYLASAPKSNASYSALLKAQKDVKQTLNEPIPLHLRNAPTKLMKDLGYGKDYKYPHNYGHNHVEEEYLPQKLSGRRYYFPTEQGFEKKIKERLERLRKSADSSKTKSAFDKKFNGTYR